MLIIITDVLRRNKSCQYTLKVLNIPSYQRNTNITPYWRTLKADGELNIKYPEAIDLQKRLLEEEGHTIISKGTKDIKYYVKDYKESLIKL